jgi:hypothetical protein
MGQRRSYQHHNLVINTHLCTCVCVCFRVRVCVCVFMCVCLHVRALLATNPLGNGRHGNREQALCVVEVANPVSLSHGDSLRHVAAIRPQMDVNVGFCVNGGQS